MAATALSNPLRHTPLQLVAGWLPAGLISTDSLKDIVRRAVPGRWVDHPNFWAVACDYATGKRVPFGRADAPDADVADAVAASCAIPGFYRPVKIGGRRYVDGGVCSASNLDLLAGRGLDLVICLNPLSSTRRPALEQPARLAGAAEPRRQRAPARARGQEGPRLRHRGRADPADRGRPRRDGTQPDEPPSRRDQVIETAVRDRDRAAPRSRRAAALLAGLPEGEPHKVAPARGPAVEWPAIVPAVRRAA